MGTLSKKRICFLKNKRTRLINNLIDTYTYAYHLEDYQYKEYYQKQFETKCKYWVFKINQIDNKLKTTRFKRGFNINELLDGSRLKQALRQLQLTDM